MTVLTPSQIPKSHYVKNTALNGLTESNGDNTLFRLLIAFAYYANNLKEEKNEKIKVQLN